MKQPSLNQEVLARNGVKKLFASVGSDRRAPAFIHPGSITFTPRAIYKFVTIFMALSKYYAECILSHDFYEIYSIIIIIILSLLLIS